VSNSLKIVFALCALLSAKALASNGGGMKPPGDVFSCVQASRNYLIGTKDVKATFLKINKEWACLSDEDLTLCKETTLMVFDMYKKGFSNKSIQNAIYSKGAWTAGICNK
jgi:hypothetical protein